MIIRACETIKFRGREGYSRSVRKSNVYLGIPYTIQSVVKRTLNAIDLPRLLAGGGLGN